MAKIYFRYGTVGSAKTLTLLAVAHKYRQQGKEVLLLKPELDDRFGKDNIRSRAGLEMTADIMVQENTKLDFDQFLGMSCILVDEVQFMSPYVIDQFREGSIILDIPFICYGLKTDFRTNLFPGSKRLIEIADSIEEIKCTCYFCNKKGIFNLKHVNGTATVEGPSVQLGAEEMYYPTCCRCYKKQVEKAKVKKALKK